MRPVRLIAVPYDSGHRGLRMGAGPLDLLAHGAAERAGAPTTVIEARNPWRSEVGTSFELAGLLAGAVEAACSDGALPLVLAGNCSTSLGTLAGLGPGDAGILWLDAHADLNTPETTPSGFLDGMALAIATGRCWRGMASTIPGFRPIADERVALLGTRDLDPPEAAVLEGSAMRVVRAADVTAGLPDALEGLRAAGTRRLYLHVDLDVHDPSTCRANRYAVDGGLSLEQTLGVIRSAAESMTIAAVAITAYDPDADERGRAREVALRIVETVARAA